MTAVKTTRVTNYNFFFPFLFGGAHVTIRDFPGDARETENFSSCSLYLRKKGKFISSVVQTYA